MKKLNLKKIKFKELLIQHVEKGVLALAGIALIMFVVSASGREKLPEDMEPQRLQERSTQAQVHVEKGDPRSELKYTPPNYRKRAERELVQLANYRTTGVFNIPVTESKLVRTEPAVLTVTDLRVDSGFSPFALLPEEKVVRNRPRPGMGGEEDGPAQPIKTVIRENIGGARVTQNTKLAVKYWTAVTALVPIRDQRDEFFKVLANAVNFQPEEDLPNYIGYQIERAEVVSGDLTKLQWKPISKKMFEEFMLQWEGDIADPVKQEYVQSMFAVPLGPRVGAAWGPEVGHEPEVPLEKKLKPGERAGAMGEGDIGFEGEVPGRPGAGAANEADNDGFEQGDMRRKQIVEAQEDPELRKRLNENLAMIGEKAVKGVDHLLFRFIDYSVEPGKQYVYRVRLGVRNPNFGLPVKVLKKPEMAETKTLASGWSEPSPVATIPHGNEILAGPSAAPTVTKESTGQIRIVKVSEKVGTQVPLQEEVARGSIANFPNREVEYVTPGGDVLKTVEDFVTESLVLDIRGGKPVVRTRPKEKELLEPGEMLIVDRSGRLVAMNEFDDEETWNRYAVPEDTKPDAMEGPMAPEGGDLLEGPTRRQPGQKRGQRPPSGVNTNRGENARRMAATNK